MGEIEVEHIVANRKSLIFISKIEKTITKKVYTNMLIYLPRWGATWNEDGDRWIRLAEGVIIPGRHPHCINFPWHTPCGDLIQCA
jgi:hypothetical protein